MLVQREVVHTTCTRYETAGDPPVPMFVTPVTESGILCHKKINFMLPSGSPRYKGLALCQWRLVAHHGAVRESNLISIWQLYFYTDLLQLVPSPPLQPVARASQWLFR